LHSLREHPRKSGDSNLSQKKKGGKGKKKTRPLRHRGKKEREEGKERKKPSSTTKDKPFLFTRERGKEGKKRPFIKEEKECSERTSPRRNVFSP